MAGFANVVATLGVAYLASMLFSVWAVCRNDTGTVADDIDSDGVDKCGPQVFER